MAELKTLKDIEGIDAHEERGYGEDFPWKHEFDIKQEAINWLKADLSFTNFDEVEIKGFIKHFFNIIDEDLK